MIDIGWLTNDAEAATLLRAADAAYLEAREAARHLPLAKKIEALRAAKRAYKLAQYIGSKSDD